MNLAILMILVNLVILSISCEMWKPKIRKHRISVAEIPKNTVFAPKNTIYGILVANVAKSSTFALLR